MKTLINLTNKVKSSSTETTADQRIKFMIEAIGLIEYQKSKGIPNPFND
jgi:hypothetical protein